MLTRPDGYGLPLVLAVGLHVLVATIFVVQWDHGEVRKPEPVPRHMVANVIQEENKAVKQRREKAQAAKQRAERQRQQAAKTAQQKRQRLAEQKRQAEQKAQREREKKAAQKREQALAAKREREAQQQRQRELEKQRQAEQQRREQQLAEEQALLEQRQLEQELQRQLDAEAAAEAAARTAATHIDMIRSRIESLWRYPPAVEKNQQVSVRLTLVPTGEVVQVEVVRSSGNQALDRSVEQAVRRASPLPVPDDIQLFERQFRTLTMNFRPENAMW